MLKRNISPLYKAAKLLIAVGTVCIPFVLLLLWRKLTLTDVLASHPTISDELGYWRLLFSFSECGTDFGFCGGFINCEPPLGHFGSHGLSPLFAWGWYALLFPWKFGSLAQANFLMLCVAMLAFVLLVHDDVWNMLFSALILFCFPHIFLYIGSHWMETPCAAGMIFYAGFYIRYRKSGKRGFFLAALFVGVWLSVLRYCYLAVLFPLVWEACGFRLNGKSLLVLLLFVAAGLGLIWLLGCFMAPYPENVLVRAGETESGIQILLTHAGENFRLYFSKQEHEDTEFFLRMAMCAFSLIFLIAARMEKGKERGFYASLAITLFVLTAANILFYDIGYQKEFRVMSPVLLFALLAAVNDGDGKFVGKSLLSAAVAAGLVIAVFQVKGYGERNEYNMFFMPQRFSELPELSEEIGTCFGKEKGTAAIRVSESFETVAFIPPQISVQWVFDESELENSTTDYIITMTDSYKLPEGYAPAGEPVPNYRIFAKQGETTNER